MKIVKSKLTFEVEIYTHGSAEVSNLKNLNGAFLNVIKVNTNSGYVLLGMSKTIVDTVKDEE
jgi:hypothetical protein